MINVDNHHRHTIRLQGYDYSGEGAYFITICTYDRGCLFGNIEGETLKCSPIGEMVREIWIKIPDHFGNVKLDEFIIMPNHIHGIILIQNCRGVKFNAPTNHNDYYSKISPKQGSLSVIVRTYKSTVTYCARKRGYECFKWQRNYYEHIIRNEEDLNMTREYIINNPLKWEFDEENLILGR